MASPAEDNSLYAVLNVSKNATDEEIKRAYRRLAQVFHPDKHTSDHMRDKAQEAFARLQKAYEVLSDPEKREVYDIYGEEGLVAGLEVILAGACSGMRRACMQPGSRPTSPSPMACMPMPHWVRGHACRQYYMKSRCLIHLHVMSLHSKACHVPVVVRPSCSPWPLGCTLQSCSGSSLH